MPKSACFDVLGTCFDFTPTIDTIRDRLGDKLTAVNVDPKSLFFSWFYAAQRDFTYTSICGSYTPIAKILKLTFKRACMIVDLPADQVSDEDVAAVMDCITKLPPRKALRECFDGLRKAGWDVYAVTNGGKQTSLKYYELANIELDADHLLSCDDIQVAKPDIRVYEAANQHLTSGGVGREGDGERWFVAAHSWDLIAARKAGFKTAWVAHEEFDPVTEVFGGFDLYAKDFGELLEKMKGV
ncbi:hypothetical protein B0A55_03856 [Friedmanniomyces simplex]|uniref:Haloacid dehalogenase, type II n=1 Tax=Friedmanniomyces simplex TaxID=329884 RepID=A0A4U0XD88_9PEZI|nr:hypothetical protein B0A55_03856 [Friedmanniomyces simplex]